MEKDAADFIYVSWFKKFVKGLLGYAFEIKDKMFGNISP